ncbi:MAG TPA: S8/S53 family peptidase [Symbiobacteriaceae bacterium]|nr:S8/S53 family peptidase [Symbiobacteriaceae bacterium]
MLRSKPSRRWLLALLVLGICLSVTACAVPPKAELSRSPKPPSLVEWARRDLPPKPTRKYGPFDLDLRQMDLLRQDLSVYGETLSGMASFDTATRWPDDLPAGFDPKKSLALGKDPGLGVRQLHRSGVTGKGVHVAFIDQTLMVDHQEYKDRISFYGEIGDVGQFSSMHGPAVVSILAGKETGVAPAVSVTFYAVQFGKMENGQYTNKRTFIYLAQAVNAILDKNATLSDKDKIRVIGMSIGWGPDEEGYAEIERAVERAKRAGVFIISTSLERDYGFKFHGLGRDPLADPNDPKSYRAGSWWLGLSDGDGRLLIPMDSRTTAGMGGVDEYAFYRQGGWSWCVPYLEGLYAMALQVKPGVTPDKFFEAAIATAQSVTVEDDGTTYKLGAIVNPQALIERLKQK